MFYYKNRSIPIPIFSSVDERWRRLRTAANPIAARPQTVYLYITKHFEVVDEFIRLVEKQLVDGTIKNFEKQLQHLSLERKIIVVDVKVNYNFMFLVVSVVALDKRINCLDPKTCKESVTKLIESIEGFMWYTNKLSVSLPFWQLYETRDRKKFFQCIDYTYT